MSKSIVTAEPGELRANDGPKPTDPPAAAPASVSAMVNLEILKTNLTGVFERKSVISDDKKTETVTTETLVIPVDSPKGGMSVQEIIQEVQKVIDKFSGKQGEKVDGDKIKENLKTFSTSALDQINIELRQVFLYIKNVTENKKNDDGTTTTTEKSKILEYAIDIVITSEIMKNDLFDIKSVSLAIWNTNRPKILERMQLGSIDDLLK
ncbi:MAG: hypothetical protein ACM3KR_07135 [Deltaproteobacteria bacterium]